MTSFAEAREDMVERQIAARGISDPALLTVRGRECLGRADVVVHDHRVPERPAQPRGPRAQQIAHRIDADTAGLRSQIGCLTTIRRVRHPAPAKRRRLR